jgi:ankyrin repeat protein
MLAEHPGLIHATWDWGRGDFENALNGASHVGRREVALALLEAGARLDAPCAAMLGETESIKALVRLTPQAANTRGAHGFSLLYHAGYSGRVEIAELLAPQLTALARDCNQALQSASQSGHAELVAWLLHHGVDDPNTKNVQGKTPLDLAAERQHTHVVALLRAAGGVATR